MPGIFAFVALIIGYMMSGNYHPSQTATITPTPSPTEASVKAGVRVPNFTPTPENTHTPTPTKSPTPTHKPTSTPTITPSPTNTPTPTRGSTPSLTPKPTIIPTVKVTYSTPTPTTTAVVVQSGGSYVCNCSITCSSMSSCAEAQYQLNVCGCTARDADHDGIACDADCQ